MINSRRRHHSGTTVHEWVSGATAISSLQSYVKSCDLRHASCTYSTYIMIHAISYTNTSTNTSRLRPSTSSNAFPRLRLLVVLRINTSVPSRVLAVVALEVHSQARRILHNQKLALRITENSKRTPVIPTYIYILIPRHRLRGIAILHPIHDPQ